MVDFLPKVKIEVVLADDMVEKAVEALLRAAQTGRIGDGNLFVSSIEKPSRIRTARPARRHLISSPALYLPLPSGKAFTQMKTAKEVLDFIKSNDVK